VLFLASASVDWAAFQIDFIDTDANDNITPSLTFFVGDFDTRFTLVRAQENFYVSDFSSTWTGRLTVNEGGSHPSANTHLLQAWVSATPSTLSSSAQPERQAEFMVTANTLVIFQVGTSGLGSRQDSSGTLYASFFSGTEAEMQGNSRVLRSGNPMASFRSSLNLQPTS
jgi:hypothetical protein